MDFFGWPGFSCASVDVGVLQLPLCTQLYDDIHVFPFAAT